MNNKSDANVIHMNPEQEAQIKACGRRIDNLRGNHARVARQAGELRDQLRAAEQSESTARQALKEAEAEFDATMNQIAVQLGHTPEQSWRFDQNECNFIVTDQGTPPEPKEPAPPETETGKPEATH